MRGIAVRLAAIAAIGTLLGLSAAHAAPLVADDFAGFADGNLAGQGQWVTAAAGTSTVQVASGAVSMAPSPTGSTLEIVRRPLGQSFNTAGTSLYYGIDINVTAANSDWYTGFSSTGSSYGAKLHIKSEPGGGYLLGWYVGSGSANPQFGTTPLTLGQTVRVVMRYDFVSGTTNDTGAIYVIPTSASDYSDPNAFLYLTTGTFTGQADVSTIAAINFHRGGSNGSTLTMDNLAVGAWSDVVPVPEPTVLSLLGTSAVLLTNRRRKM